MKRVLITIVQCLLLVTSIVAFEIPTGEVIQNKQVTNQQINEFTSKAERDIITINIKEICSTTPFTTIVSETDYAVDQVIVKEIPFPVTSVIATVEGDEALITWAAPNGENTGEWVTKATVGNEEYFGTGEGSIIAVSQKYTEAELVSYQGMYINAIKFFPSGAMTSYTVGVWGGFAGSTELYTQEVTSGVSDEWREVILDSSVAIPASGPIFFGYIVNNPSGFHFGCDAGPVVPGGDMIKFEGQENWDTLSELTSLSINWGLQAFVSFSPNRQVASATARNDFRRANSHATKDTKFRLGASETSVSPTSTRACEGYRVWRLLTSDQDNEANWTSLTDEIITDLSFTDTAWTSLPSGAYKYAVKAIYTNDLVSPVTLSNELLKDMYGTVEGLVMDETGAPITGASVNLAGTIATTNSAGYYLFTDLLVGDYNITATAYGYISLTQEVTLVCNQVTTIDFFLAESFVLFNDGFETYPDFALEAGAWILVDSDLSSTYSITDTSWENAEAPQSYIVFNPAMTTPPLSADYQPHNGSKYMACFASTTTDNNDWIITQEVTLGFSGAFNFWAKSITNIYGLERFRVLISSGYTNPNDFYLISDGSFVEAPTDWTEFSYDLSDFENQTVRLAIQCVSSDAFMFTVDDVLIYQAPSWDNNINDIVCASQLKGNYPNPFNPETTISFTTKKNGPVSIDVFNIKGQKVRTLLNENRQAGNHIVVWNGKDDSGNSLASGVFFYRMKSGKYTSTKKMILMK